MSVQELQREWRNSWPNSSQQALERAQNSGFAVLGVGGRRITLEKDSQTVYKLAWREEGLGDNVIEERMFQEASPDLKRLLCPVYQRDPSGFLIEAKCLPVSQEALGERGLAVCQTLSQYGITDCAVNLGLYLSHGEWRVVCYDFCVLKVEMAMRLLHGAHLE